MMSDAVPYRDLRELARSAGIEHVHLLAWRDLADTEAGGSELHAARIAALWADVGLDVTMRTSYAQGQAREQVHDGYRVIRRSGRYGVFPSAAVNEVMHRHGPRDAIVEIWNGVPFMSPLWFKGPNVVVVHHVHHNMWAQVLDKTRARVGDFVESKVAPRFYQHVPLVTVSESSKHEMITTLGLPAEHITVASPGVDPRFRPNGSKSPHAMILGVGRLTRPKRFDEMIRAAQAVRVDHPDLELVIVGDGYEKTHLEELVHSLDVGDWVRLAGHVSDGELVRLYQQAWVLASTSSAEGWGMTIIEAAACGTPSVATRITGHVDSIHDGHTGLLASSSWEMTAQLNRLLSDASLRAELGRQAELRAAKFTWEACAVDTFRPLTIARR